MLSSATNWACGPIEPSLVFYPDSRPSASYNRGMNKLPATCPAGVRRLGTDGSFYSSRSHHQRSGEQPPHCAGGTGLGRRIPVHPGLDGQPRPERQLTHRLQWVAARAAPQPLWPLLCAQANRNRRVLRGVDQPVCLLRFPLFPQLCFGGRGLQPASVQPPPYRLTIPNPLRIGATVWSFEMAPAFPVDQTPQYGSLRLYPSRTVASYTSLSHPISSTGSVSRRIPPDGSLAGSFSGWVAGQLQGYARSAPATRRASSSRGARGCWSRPVPWWFRR